MNFKIYNLDIGPAGPIGPQGPQGPVGPGGAGITMNDQSIGRVAYCTNTTDTLKGSDEFKYDEATNSVTTGANIITNQPSFDLLNTTATTINLGGAATTITQGNTTNASQVKLSKVIIDRNNNNNGTIANGYTLNFGDVSGEGIGSNRNNPANGNELGLDFYTNSVRRLQITNDGRVGIGTADPGAALDINTSSSEAYTGYYIKFNPAFGVQTLQSENFGPGPWPISLRTVNWIYSGAGYMTSSDKRIKDIISKSDSKKDLETLNNVIITDYTMKDKITDNKKYKKIIAQDLENIYPESVYKTKNIIPNIYKTAVAEKGIIFLETNLQKNTNIKIILENENIISKVLNVSDTYFEIENKDISGNIFVYGSEVDDFLSIDYESVFCLNISATQELYSRMKKLENIVTFLEKKIDNLEKNLQSSQTK